MLDRCDGLVDFRKELFDGSAVAEDGARNGSGLWVGSVARVGVEEPSPQASKPAQPSREVDATAVGEAKVEDPDVELFAFRLGFAARVCHHDAMAMTGQDVTHRRGDHLAGLH